MNLTVLICLNSAHLHVYQTIWEPKLNEELLSKLELCNEYDRNVVCVIKT